MTAVADRPSLAVLPDPTSLQVVSTHTIKPASRAIQSKATLVNEQRAQLISGLGMVPGQSVEVVTNPEDVNNQRTIWVSTCSALNKSLPPGSDHHFKTMTTATRTLAIACVAGKYVPVSRKRKAKPANATPASA
jgi:hypothetical protein